MHQLLLLRHARSSSDDTAMADRDRPLNARGLRAAAAMRRAMRELGLAPDLILVSSARRTMETMSALEPWDDTPLVECLDELYLASENRLLGELRDVAETVRTVMLIGHNPGLHDLATTLADRHASAGGLVRAIHEGFPTGALAEFSIAFPWHRLGPGGGRLLRFLTPRGLRGPDLDQPIGDGPGRDQPILDGSGRDESGRDESGRGGSGRDGSKKG
jgi:phosphohistidine phosphatase